MPTRATASAPDVVAAGRPTPAELIARRAGATPDAVAYLEGATGRTLTWSDVAASADHWRQLAAQLPPATRVGLLADAPLDAVAGFLGALAAGVLVAPLDPGARPDELAAAATRLGVAAVAADAASTDLAAGLGARTGAAHHQAGPEGIHLVTGGSPSAGLPAPAPAALLMASSGTTGDPKLIPLSADQLLATADAVVEAHRLTAGDTGYSPLPLWHINGLVVGVLSTLRTGGRLVVDRRFSATRFWSTVSAGRATWLNLVPAIIGILGRPDAPQPPDAGGIRFARSASAPLPAAARDAFEARTGIAVVETYGMTEAASQIAANPIDAARPGTVGRATTGIEIRVVDTAKGGPAAPGTTGEVHLRGPRVTASYWTPGATTTRPATDADGWLATGDLGALDADGYLTLAGRADDVINRGGEKVFPREVEEVLLSDPEVTGAAVVGRPDALLGAVPVAYVTLADGAARSAAPIRLAERCGDKLSRAKRPVEILVVDALPTGATGKVKHAALRKLLGAGHRAPSTGTPDPNEPRPPHEVTLMSEIELDLPPRTTKPRATGLTMVIDGGQPTSYFLDAVRSAADLVDVVKFGWGTALVTPDLDTKLAALRELGIRYYFGGTLFEKFVTQDRFDAFLDFVAAKGADTVEISNGTIPLTNTGKAAYIRKAADRFTVVSEVGFKDSERSGRQSPGQWVDAIEEDLEAGASMVITEARESGSSGICRANGDLRDDLVEVIISSGVPADRILWEAPTKKMQTFFVTRLGTNVNLGNIPVDGVIGVETLRLGLRADTLLHVEQEMAERQAWHEAWGLGDGA